MRVVFDTNIFISAFAIPGGRAEEAYLSAIHGRFELFTSTAILTETANTLLSKFAWSDEKFGRALQAISKSATVLKTQPHPCFWPMKSAPWRKSFLSCSDTAPRKPGGRGC